jgi:sec-independent protein translocase protein TatB
MNLSPEKLFVVGLIALMVLGPDRLPVAARTAGRTLAELRRLSAGMQSEIAKVMAEPREMLDKATAELGLEQLHGVAFPVEAGTALTAAADDPSFN